MQAHFNSWSQLSPNLGESLPRVYSLTSGWRCELDRETDLLRRCALEHRIAGVYSALHALVSQHCPSATGYLESGKWEELQRSISLVAPSPQPHLAHMLRGIAALLGGDSGRASVELAQAVVLSDGNVEAALLHSISLLQGEQWDLASDCLRDLLTVASADHLPAAATCCSLRAVALSAAGRDEEAHYSRCCAIDMFEELEKSQAGAWTAPLALLHAEMALHQSTAQPAKCLSKLRKAGRFAARYSRRSPAGGLFLVAAIARAYGIALLSQAKVEAARRSFEEALDSLRKALAIEPWRWQDLILLHFELAADFTDIDEEEAANHYLLARQVAKEGYARNPNPALCWQGQAELALGDMATGDERKAARHYKAAIQLLQSALDWNPELHDQLVRAHYGVGVALVNSRLWIDGIAHLNKALEHAAARKALASPCPKETLVLAIHSKRVLAASLLHNGRRPDAETLLFEARGDARRLMDSESAEPLNLVSAIEGDLLAIFANVKRFDVAEKLVTESMEFLLPYAQKEPEKFGDVYAMQAKHLIKLMIARKAPQVEQRRAAKAAAELARNPLISEMMTELGKDRG